MCACAGVATVWDLGAGSVRAQWSASSFSAEELSGTTDLSFSSSLPQPQSGGASASAAPMEQTSNGTTEAHSSSANASASAVASTAIAMDSGASAAASASASASASETLDAGATCLLVASRAPVAVVGTRAGLLSVWDLRLAGGPGSRPVRLLDGHAAQVLDMCWLPCATLHSLSSLFVDSITEVTGGYSYYSILFLCEQE